MPATGTRAKASRCDWSVTLAVAGMARSCESWSGGCRRSFCGAGNQRYSYREWMPTSRVHGLRYAVTGTADWHNTES